MVRDETIHMQGKRKHSLIKERALYDDMRGKATMEEAIYSLSTTSTALPGGGSVELVIASYETLMSLQTPYLHYLYEKLDINSTYNPNFKDGNLKYVTMRDW